MDLKGNVGSSPVAWDVALDAKLNLVLSLSYADASGAYAKMEGGVALTSVLDQLVAKLKSPTASGIEQGLVAALEMYLATQPSA